MKGLYLEVVLFELAFEFKEVVVHALAGKVGKIPAKDVNGAQDGKKLGQGPEFVYVPLLGTQEKAPVALLKKPFVTGGDEFSLELKGAFEVVGLEETKEGLFQVALRLAEGKLKLPFPLGLRDGAHEFYPADFTPLHHEPELSRVVENHPF